MVNISKSDIKDLTYDLTFKQGEIYYKQGKVLNLNIESIDDDFRGNNSHIINGSVKDSNNRVYYPRIVIYDKKGFDSIYCDCNDFGRLDGACKHIIAVLLRCMKDTDNLMESIEKQKFNTFIEGLKHSLVQTTTTKKELCMDVKIVIKKEPFSNIDHIIELKVGENKKYVVKNMRAFIDSLICKRPLEFGKGFKYDPILHTFNEIDSGILNIIKEIYEIQNNIMDNRNYYFNSLKMLKGKGAYLTETQLKRLLNLLENKNFEIQILDKTYTDVKIIKENLPLEFIINSYENNIKISQNHKNIMPLTKDGEFFFYNGIIYSPDYKQIKLYTHFFNTFAKKDEVVVPKENLKELSEFIIPSMKAISSEIKIDEDIKSHILSEPLLVNVYLDKIDDFITACVEFQYGEHTINPLISNYKEDFILIRDVTHEMEVTNLLKSYGFCENKDIFVLEDEDCTVNFLYEGLEALEKMGTIYHSDSFKNVKIYSSSTIRSSIKLNDNDLLEISFDLDDINKNELKDIFDGVKTKKKYHRLKNGGFLLLDSIELSDFSNTIDYLGIKSSDLSKDKILLAKYNSIYINEKFKDNKMIEVKKDKRFRDTINNFKKINESSFKAPPHIDKVLREYQKVGLKWFRTLSYFGFGGILADEMGLGKTLQAISFIASSYNTTENRTPTLVVCPTSLMYNWENEIQKFAPELKSVVVCGSKEYRMDKLNNMCDVDVVITSYPLIRIDIDKYTDFQFSYFFLDEAQYIKNPNSLSCRSVKEIKASGYFALTGTPIENSLTELWSIFDFIMPGYLLSHGKFTKLYETPIIKNSDTNALDELNKHIQPFILRRHKKDVVKELPEKIEHTVVVELCDEQKKLYTSYISSFKDEIKEEISTNGFNKSKLKILSLLTRLRQLCCDPSIFIENYKGESSKMNALLDILQNSLEEGHRVLIFSQFTSMLKNIQKELKLKHIKYMYLDGSIKSEDRLSLVDSFNAGNGDVFLISLKAGGTGLNLTGADTVIHFDPWWNPAVENQASDRAHRIGQQKAVEVIRLITKGTIEEKISSLQQKKKDIFDMTIENSSESNMFSKMDENDIKELFDF